MKRVTEDKVINDSDGNARGIFFLVSSRARLVKRANRSNYINKTVVNMCVNVKFVEN